MSNSTKKEDKTLWERIVSRIDWLLAILLLVLLLWFLWALLLQKPANDTGGVELINNLPAKNKCIKDSSNIGERQKYHFNHYDFYFYQVGCARIDFYLMTQISQTVESSQEKLKTIGFQLTPVPQFAIQLLPDNKVELLGNPGYARAGLLGTGENVSADAWRQNTNYLLSLAFVSDNRPNYKDKKQAAEALAFYLSGKKYNGSNTTVQRLYSQLVSGKDSSYKAFRDSLNS